MKIGIFDSGIGGLTVLKEMLKVHPNAHYIYYGDTKNLPYGEKRKEELMTLTHNIIKFLIKKEVDLVIIACGTISSNVYDEIKDEYSVKIIDVINPTINYIKENKLTDIGVLGTYMTVKSEVFEKKLDDVKSVACPKFVPAIESGNPVDEAATEYLKQLETCKNIVLGCTHYPLITQTLKKYKDVNYINMGQCVANSIKLEKEVNQKIELHFSKIDDKLKENINKIMNEVTIEE